MAGETKSYIIWVDKKNDYMGCMLNILNKDKEVIGCRDYPDGNISKETMDKISKAILINTEKDALDSDHI